MMLRILRKAVGATLFLSPLIALFAGLWLAGYGKAALITLGALLSIFVMAHAMYFGSVLYEDEYPPSSNMPERTPPERGVTSLPVHGNGPYRPKIIREEAWAERDGE